jgi:Rieske Fe-S protein
MGRAVDAPVLRAVAMIRPHTDTTVRGLIGRIKRRQLFRLGFLTGTLLALTEITALIYPFGKVNKILGLGAKIAVGTKASVLDTFKSTNDTPILNIEGKFFLLHAPGGIIAAYRKCTHLGCSVPWNAAEDQFHCPCHGSLYDKHTATVKGGPAPKPLQLFHLVADASGALIVDTNPLNVINRPETNVWNPKDLEITE